MALSNILAGVIFGSVGFVAFIYGKRQSRFRPMLLGLSLMIFPYFVTDAIWLYALGSLLTAALFIFRD